MTTKAQNSEKVQDNKSTEKKTKFSKELLDALNAVKISESASKNGKKSIFKSAFNDKALRTKYRNALCKISLVEIEGGKTVEVQKGLIPTFILQIQKGKEKEALETFAEIKNICKKVYVAEDSFKDANDYFSSNRSVETQNLLKTFIAVAQEM